MPDFDVVIVGSGPGGATAADVLTEEGRSVCVLEKGRNHLLALEEPFAGLGHLSNDEIKFGRRHFLGPDPLLEPRTYRRSVSDGERAMTGDVNNMPSTVGGAGFHADGKLPRYREGIAALGDDLDLDGQPELRQLLFEHACEASYGAPEYGGNTDLLGWQVIGADGDVQPRGYTDDEVRGRA